MDLNTDIEAEIADFMQVAPKMPESLEADASKHESSTSISGEDKSKNQNLNLELDDLTRQLKEALDKNEVVGWKESLFYFSKIVK